MRRRKMKVPRTIAISLLMALFLPVSFVFVSEAAIAGRVTHLSGPLFAKKADGTKKSLSISSIVEEGDVLVTEQKTYARVKFTDQSEITLRPRTQLKVSKYYFQQTKPKDDSVTIDLIKGGMRALTGLIGKRGNQDGYRLNTPTSVAGVRGTAYECRICEGNCGSLPNGLYLFVLEGIVNVSNSAGSQDVNAGQYVYVSSLTSVPQILATKPEIDFTLPAVVGGDTSGGNKDGSKKPDSGCIVR